MNYCIKYADGSAVIICLDNSGNKYSVCVWNKGEHRSEQGQYFDVYAEAESYFEWLCKAYGVEKFIKEVKHDLSELYANYD